MSSFKKISIILASFFFTSLIVACQSNAGTVSLEVNETGAEITEVTEEIIRMNNCGGTAESEQIAQRSQIITIEGGGKLGVDGQVIKGEVSAKYSDSSSVSKSQKLIAPAGTNMEFILNWTEKMWVGVVMAQGKDDQAEYEVSVPISVELVSSRDLGCDPKSPPIISSDFDVYEDFFVNPFGATLGVSEGSTEPVVENGFLRLDYDNADGQDGRGVYILNYDQEIASIGASFRVIDGHPQSYTYLQVDLGMIDGTRHYANFGTTHAGEVFYADAPDGQAPDGVEKSWAGNGPGEFNTFHIQWNGDQVQFSLNGTVVNTVMASDGGWWGTLNVGTIGSGSSLNEWDWVGWSYQ